MRQALVAFAWGLLGTTSRASAQPADPTPTEPPASTEPTLVPAVEPAADPTVAPMVHGTAAPTRGQSTAKAPLTSAHLGSPRSPLVAGALSLGLTTAGITLLVTGTDIAPHYDERGASDTWRIGVVTAGVVLTLVGPTSGHIYAGHGWNPGLKWRLISGGIAAVTLPPAFSLALSDSGGGGGGGGAAALGILGSAAVVLYSGSMLREIWTAPGAARRHNERLEEAASFSIAPVLGRAPGLAIAGRF